ncbi:hypothetical protein [Desulfocurvibacter africanus]|uniref:hypothetical protein n=1 Tax=Desulfocurvibacter africanus TaxID=873 RepID=UPI00040682B3|nr:hypothetical protein [Desulfocurvibacter africanus]
MSDNRARAIRDQEEQARDEAVSLFAELGEQLGAHGEQLPEPVVVLGLVRRLEKELSCLLGMKTKERI